MTEREPADDRRNGASGVPQRPTVVWWRQALSIVVTVAVVVAVFGFVFPRIADYGDVIDVIGTVDRGEWLILGALAVVFLLSYVPVLMAVLHSLRFREGFVAQTAGTAITNSLPAGGALAVALNYAMYLSWGFAPEAVTAGLATAGVWDLLGRLVLPVGAVTWIAISGEASAWMWTAAAAGIAWGTFSMVLLALILRSERLATAIAGWIDRLVNGFARLIRRGPVDMVRPVRKFRSDTMGILRYRWGRLTVATIVNHLAMSLLFLASIRAVGVSGDAVSTPWVLLSFAVGRLLTAIPVSPGGLGVVDVGYVALLGITAPSGSAELLAAGVLLFRGLSFLPPIVVGSGSWVFWRTNWSWRRDWHTAQRGSFGSRSERQDGAEDPLQQQPGRPTDHDGSDRLAGREVQPLSDGDDRGDDHPDGADEPEVRNHADDEGRLGETENAEHLAHVRRTAEHARTDEERQGRPDHPVDQPGHDAAEDSTEQADLGEGDRRPDPGQAIGQNDHHERLRGE